jgi:hypothetical protein
MTQTLVIMLCIVFGTLLNTVLIYVGLSAIKTQLTLLQDDVSAIRIRSVPANVGGRLAPSPADLEAARNRMDKLGVARPGGPG